MALGSVRSTKRLLSPSERRSPTEPRGDVTREAPGAPSVAGTTVHARSSAHEPASRSTRRTPGSTRLRERSAVRLTESSVNEQQAVLALRNRLITLLLDRMRRVRAAARYVFRNHPEIARRATSTYERRRRARSRAQAATEAAPASEGGE